jgi:hypothetical protein
MGVASGKGNASYRISFDSGDIVIPDCANDGFIQRAVKSGNGWEVRVEVSLEPLRLRESWAISRKMEKSLSVLGKDLKNELIAKLSSSTSKDDAVIKVLQIIAGKWNYVEKDDSGLTLDQLMASGNASCLGMVRLSQHILSLLEIPSKEVIGIRFPADQKIYSLKGGALHAWLEIEAEKGRWVFCDPRSTFGFVPEYFIVLKKDGSFGREDIRSIYGGTVELRANEDRIYYDPLSAVKPDFWKRPSYDALTQGVLLGKVLTEYDLPVEGQVSLSNDNGSLRTVLWKGNFYFKIMSPGIYTLKVMPAGRKQPAQKEVELSDLSRNKVVVYVESGGISVDSQKGVK